MYIGQFPALSCVKNAQLLPSLSRLYNNNYYNWTPLSPQYELAPAAGLVFIVALLTPGIERLTRSVEFDDERDLVANEWVGRLLELGPHPQLVLVRGDSRRGGSRVGVRGTAAVVGCVVLLVAAVVRLLLSGRQHVQGLEGRADAGG